MMSLGLEGREVMVVAWQEVVSRLVWRMDDTAEALERRLAIYRDKTLPVLGKPCFHTVRRHLESADR
jgi:adenylate kinase family enzyme